MQISKANFGAGVIFKLLDPKHLLGCQEYKDLMSILDFIYKHDKKRKWGLIHLFSWPKNNLDRGEVILQKNRHILIYSSTVASAYNTFVQIRKKNTYYILFIYIVQSWWHITSIGNNVIINIQIHDFYVTLLDMLSCAVHNLLNHMQWLCIVAILDSFRAANCNNINMYPPNKRRMLIMFYYQILITLSFYVIRPKHIFSTQSCFSL